jgi:hypothetical protein
MLCLIEKYVKFRQGDVWRQIKEEFVSEVRQFEYFHVCLIFAEGLTEDCFPPGPPPHRR